MAAEAFLISALLPQKKQDSARTISFPFHPDPGILPVGMIPSVLIPIAPLYSLIEVTELLCLITCQAHQPG
jgi:hypothetical protein